MPAAPVHKVQKQLQDNHGRVMQYNYKQKPLTILLYKTISRILLMFLKGKKIAHENLNFAHLSFFLLHHT